MYRAKQIIAFLALVFSAFSGRSQEISVGSFNLLPNDMTVRTAAPVFDANGDLAALIKVVTTATGFDFDGGSLGIVKVDWQPGEVWVYVPPGARMLTIRHPQLGVLRNYAYPVSIASGNVYELRLVSGEIEVSVKERQILTEFVIIESEPRNADVYLNNELVGKTTFSSAFPEGRYEWRLVSDLYLPEAGVFELKAGEKQKIAVKLKPNFGSIQVTSLPESGAKITLNGVKLGMATPYTMMEVPVGEHIITLTHESYETITQKVVVSPGETEVLSIAMEPNFAELVVSAQDDEEVYINGVRRGTGRFSSRLAPGVYSVEVRKSGHRTAARQLSLKRGDKEILTLRPEPIFSTLQVVSEPIDAEIYLNGKLVGTTPHILRELVVGEYEVELRLDGYGSEKHMVVVTEGELVEVNAVLDAKVSVVFTSEPSEVDLYVNGVYRGSTPFIVTELPRVRYIYELKKPGYAPFRGSIFIDDDRNPKVVHSIMTANSEQAPEITKERLLFKFMAKVLDTETGAPLSNARVVIEGSNGDTHHLTTDQNGYVQLVDSEIQPESEYSVSIVLDGYIVENPIDHIWTTGFKDPATFGREYFLKKRNNQ